VRLEDCKLEGHPIHLYSPRSALATPHVLLAGDAAGADPLLGEGISLALGYGRLAARALVDAFTRDDLSFADYTGVVHHSALGRSLRNRHAAARLLYRLRHPLLQRALFWHLQPLVRRFIREHMFRWARPQPLPPRSAALAAQPAA
jgi:flavin-dependent dehydrogenase